MIITVINNTLNIRNSENAKIQRIPYISYKQAEKITLGNTKMDIILSTKGNMNIVFIKMYLENYKNTPKDIKLTHIKNTKVSLNDIILILYRNPVKFAALTSQEINQLYKKTYNLILNLCLITTLKIYAQASQLRNLFTIPNRFITEYETILNTENLIIDSLINENENPVFDKRLTLNRIARELSLLHRLIYSNISEITQLINNTLNIKREIVINLERLNENIYYDVDHIYQLITEYKVGMLNKYLDPIQQKHFLSYISTINNYYSLSCICNKEYNLDILTPTNIINNRKELFKCRTQISNTQFNSLLKALEILTKNLLEKLIKEDMLNLGILLSQEISNENN
jgi:hypothetical protein